MSNNNSNDATAAPSKDGLVHLVVQRYRGCSILLDEKDWVSVGEARQRQPIKNDDNNDNSQEAEDTAAQNDSSTHCGLLVYVSFAVGATKASVESAAECILNLPLLTTGLWGDGTSPPQSLSDFVQSKQATSLVLCPQANLIAKVKGSGRSLQYRGQIDKETGKELFLYLGACLAGLLLEQQCQRQNQQEEEEETTDKDMKATLPPLYLQWKKRMEQERQKESYEQQQQQRQSSQANPSVPPAELFRDGNNSDAYSAWDDEGMPTKDAQGQALTKSALKKLKKIRDAHTKRHEKWLKQQQQESTNQGEDERKPSSDKDLVSSEEKPKAAVVANTDDVSWMEALDPNICQLVVGSFGMRQGLEVSSDMGPFCHVMQV